MSKKMNYYILLSEISLLVVNITFLVAGTFFNTVVVLSIWKSSQIRKKLCYFMIFILSCTDLLVVIVLHPLHIFYCIIWYFKGTLDYEHSNVFHFIGSILIVSSFTVLFTMTLERYIGLTRPFFHKTFLTRRRLVSFLVVCLIVLLSVELGDFILKRQSMGHIYGVIVLSLTVLLVISMNCKMFLIAKPRAGNRNVKFKPYYTCALAVTCFLFCCFPVTTQDEKTNLHQICLVQICCKYEICKALQPVQRWQWPNLHKNGQIRPLPPLHWLQSFANFIFATYLHQANLGKIQFFIQCYLLRTINN